MSGWNNWSVKGKLFSIMLLILTMQAVILLFAGSSLFERFYTVSKIAELRELAQGICDAYEEGSSTFFDHISKAEYENVLVVVFSREADKSLHTVYRSRGGHQEDDRWHKEDGLPPKPEGPTEEERFETMLQSDMESRLRETEKGFNVQVTDVDKNDKKSRGKWFPDSGITLVARLADNLYLYAFTPLGYIKSTADLAVDYTAFLSLIILAMGAFIIYFLVGRLVRPIRRIQEVADKIARLDFSQKCVVTGGDEISRLGESINRMSHELENAIGKLVSANEVLKSDLERQQKTERIRRQFIADVSHDFKTPLTLIVSYAEALADGRDNPQDKEYCDIIIHEGNRLSGMVGKLLELSRLENGADPVEKNIFCLSEILDEVISYQRLLTSKKQITVSRRLDEDFIVNADFQKMQRVITNLYENAVKYTPDGGQIAVAVRRISPALCRVEIENTGCQISPEDLEHLFDSFYRADKSRSHSQGSYGIGLATVRAIMEAHQQSYGVENSPDGVRFWLELESAADDQDSFMESDPD